MKSLHGTDDTYAAYSPTSALFIAQQVYVELTTILCMK